MTQEELPALPNQNDEEAARGKKGHELRELSLFRNTTMLEGSTSPADGVSNESVLSRSSEPLVIEPLRHYGRWIAAGVVALLACALFWSLFTNKNIDWSVIAKGVSKRQILNGVWMTIKLTVLSMVLGVLLGILSAIGGLSANPVLRTLSTGYTWFFRGTPLLVQIIFWFNIALLFPKIGSININTIVSPFVAALLALALNEGAYMSEIVRAGIQSVDRGQNEAAQSLGLSPLDSTVKVILPQAMRVIIPPTGNEVISMLKSTSLVSVIAARDLLTQAQLIYSRTFQVIDYLIVISIWYLILTTILTLGQRVLEKRFGRGFGLLTEQHGPGLQTGLAEQNPWRQRRAGVVTRVERFLAGERLAADDPLGRLLDDLVEQQERLAVWDSGVDGGEGHVFECLALGS